MISILEQKVLRELYKERLKRENHRDVKRGRHCEKHRPSGY